MLNKKINLYRSSVQAIPNPRVSTAIWETVTETKSVKWEQIAKKR